MFTGLIESLATVSEFTRGDGCRLTLRQPNIASALKLGESVAVNGVCLTVVASDPQTFAFEVGPETLRCTNLGQLRVGDQVNLERSLRAGDRLGGHLVQGHIDGVGSIISRERQGEWETVWFNVPPHLAAQLAPKGSVAVDGISLTVVDVQPDKFSVALIPHTLEVTTLGRKVAGDSVNLETDVVAKYVWKYMESAGRR
jgi:riboflavin synthase